MDECIDSLGEVEWLTTLDANKGFLHMAIHEEDQGAALLQKEGDGIRHPRCQTSAKRAIL